MNRKNIAPPETDHHKRFQLERIALFSDAVFAIAITLLIIELKVPHIPYPATDAEIGEKLLEMIPEFIGFLVSFFVIGLYWLVHHRMFGYVVDYNRKLLMNNLVFLLSIVLMPFSSAFYSEYFLSYTKLPLAIYFGNICFSGLMSYRLWKMLSKPANGLSHGLENPVLVRYFLLRALLVPAVFTVAFLITLFIPPFAYYFTPVISFINRLVAGRYRRKHPGIQFD